MTVRIVQETPQALSQLGEVPISFEVKSRFRVEPVDGWLGGWSLTEEPVYPPYTYGLRRCVVFAGGGLASLPLRGATLCHVCLGRLASRPYGLQRCVVFVGAAREPPSRAVGSP